MAKLRTHKKLVSSKPAMTASMLTGTHHSHAKFIQGRWSKKFMVQTLTQSMLHQQVHCPWTLLQFKKLPRPVARKTGNSTRNGSLEKKDGTKMNTQALQINSGAVE